MLQARKARAKILRQKLKWEQVRCWENMEAGLAREAQMRGRLVEHVYPNYWYKDERGYSVT